MNRFNGNPIVEVLPTAKGWYRLHKGLTFWSEKYSRLIVVPAGFITDFASIPRFFWRILPPFGKYAAAAIVHDFLYATKPDWCNRKIADSIMLEANEVLDVKSWKRTTMYSVLRTCAGPAWKKSKPKIFDG